MFQREHVYKSFDYVGTVLTEPIPDSVDFELIPCRLSSYVERETRDWLKDHSGEYVSSKSTKETLTKSVLKMDKDPVYSYMFSPFHSQAVELVRANFQRGLQVRQMSYADIILDIEQHKSAGTIEARRGLRTKGDCLLAGIVSSEYEQSSFLEEVPIWKVSGKVELRTRIDYVRDRKQRTFIIQPFGSYWIHKKVYGLQQNAMKNLWWSYYGFNPYEGGCNRLARSINRLRRKVMGDVSGWDRLLPHMDDIYDIKNCWLEPSPEMYYATYHAINSLLHLPNGDLIRKYWGNNSGSGSTTIDNIIGMAIVIAHVYLYLGCPPEFINEFVEAALFGDDFLVSDGLKCSDSELETAYRHVFGLYGLVLDPFVVSNDISDLSFLGFRFSETALGYVPEYSLERLAVSMLYNESRMEAGAEFTKMVSLMLMSAGNGEEVFSYFHRSCSDVLYHSDSPDVKRFHLLGWSLPSYDDVIAWYLGLESSNEFLLEVDWHKEFCYE